MSELALQQIRKSKETRTTYLDLGKCGLTELPNELFELTWLEELNLSDFRWEQDLVDIGFDNHSTQNNGESNKINYLSTKISNLKSLRKLNLSVVENSERGKLIDIKPLKSLNKLILLDISNTNVEDIDTLKNLNNLEFLNIGSTKVKNIKSLKNLKNLIGLNIDYNEIYDLEPLANIKSLKYLEIRGSQAIDFQALKHLINLKYINLFNANFSDLSPIKNLQKLHTLWLNQSKINDISIIKNLISLEVLAISNTKVKDLSALEWLINLKKISLYSLNVDNFNPLSKLINLEDLALDNNQLDNLDICKNLQNLKYLDVSNTRISSLKPLNKLVNLQSLDVSNTEVSDLTHIRDLKNLNRINISNSKVNDLSPLISIINLGFRLKWINQSWDEKIIAVKDCPLDKALIAAIKKGHNAVLKYFNKTKERLFETRLLILGEPRAGKTTLRRKLKSHNADMPKETESTKAFDIEIEPYKCNIEKDGKINKLTYNLWDFGGQDYYRLLHQLFVSEQSVYIIVTDTDRNKNEEEIDFWLETIERLGKDKQGKYGPIILFQNTKTNREGSDFLDLKKRYNFWQQSEMFNINLAALAKNTEGYDKKEVDKFRRFKQYLHESFSHLDHIGREMPTQWIQIRKELSKYYSKNWIPIETFYEICHKKDITDASEKADLLDIFHALGYVLHYQTAKLQGMVIINREWVTDALYRVLDDIIVRENKGWFRESDAAEIWFEDKYKNRLSELLYLMQEFKLSYYNQHSKKHIVPAKLPDNTEGLPEWDKTLNVSLHLQYDWMPRAISTQLIVSLHDILVSLENGEQWIWRRGAVFSGEKLDLKDVLVKIEDNWKENRIEITAKGTHSEMLIRTLMKHWQEVNEPFEDKITVTKIILCSCDICQKSIKPFEFEYEEVLDARVAKDCLKCNKSRKEFFAADILRGVFDETSVLVDAFEKKWGKMGEEIKENLKNAQFNQALDMLPNDDLTLNIRQRYATFIQKEIKGVISFDEANRERNSITDSILIYLETLLNRDL